MLLDDTAAVYTFIKIMVTSYMESMSNGPDFIFLTRSHYQYHYNLQGTSEQQRMDLFCCLLAREMYCLLSQMPVSKILYMLASPATACAPPPLLCISEVCVRVYMNVPQFTPLHPHSAAVPQRTLVK